MNPIDSPDAALMLREDQEFWDSILGELLPRERAIVEDRIDGATYTELGKRFRVTPERARQIYYRSLRRIQCALRWREASKPE